MAPSDALRGVTLKPTERHPPEAPQHTLSALEDLREDIAALSQLEPADPMFSAHLGLALLKVAKRLDDLEARQ